MKVVCVAVVIIVVSVGAILLSPKQQAQQQTSAPQGVSQQAGSQQVPKRVRDEKFELEQALTAQQRANKYFETEVVPKLKACWSSLRGTGVIEFKHTFKKTGNNWRADNVAIESSTIQENQKPIALKCMQVATGDTSFPATGIERTAIADFTLYWSWSVPLPANTATTRMRRPTGGNRGCDGRGSRPKCWSCYGDGCNKTCTGSLDCATGIDSCVAFGACVTSGYVPPGTVVIK